MLSIPQIQRYLDLAQDVGRSHPLVDAHVHATEIVFRQIQYREGSRAGEILSAVDRPFEPPRIAALRLTDATGVAQRFDAKTRNRASRLHFTNAYEHIGRQVLLEHMDLARIDRALLLPVAPRDGSVEEQMVTLLAFRGSVRRLLLGYSVPNGVPTSEVASDIRQAVATYGARAVKLHPNLSGIDLGQAPGMERVESILAACGSARLPVIVHGGRSPILGDEPASRHARLQSLERVPWGRSAECVVIAHCGVFGYPPGEAAAEGVPILKRILARHENVVVDTSGLDFTLLVEMLRSLDPERVVFGSDAFYFPMWQAVVSLLHALATAGLPLEDSFARIASRNARTRLRLDA